MLGVSLGIQLLDYIFIYFIQFSVVQWNVIPMILIALISHLSFRYLLPVQVIEMQSSF